LNAAGKKNSNGKAYPAASSLDAVYSHGLAKPWFASRGTSEGGIRFWLIAYDRGGKKTGDRWKLGTWLIKSHEEWKLAGGRDLLVPDPLYVGSPPPMLSTDEIVTTWARFEELNNLLQETQVLPSAACPERWAKMATAKQKRFEKRQQAAAAKEGGRKEEETEEEELAEEKEDEMEEGGLGSDED